MTDIGLQSRDCCGGAVKLGLLCLLAGIIYFTGIQWGLPTRAVDPYLFGSHPVWTGREILDRIGDQSSSEPRGADVALTPLKRGSDPVCVNTTDAQRAQIVRRYRLFSHQPDEMITFISLADMAKRREMDPRLYQYGGMWIYPVGGLLKAAALAGVVKQEGQAYYLDHSEEFGRFYVVARAYSAAWGIVGVVVVWLIARRLAGGSQVAAIIACLGYLFMPVVVNMAHEAKPHVGGAVLMLWAVWAGMKFLDTGRGRWAILCGIMCGAALGMVLSSLPIFSVLGVLLILRPKKWGWIIGAGLVGAVVYGITNPYVVFNLIWHPQIVHSNIGNSTVMYKIGWRGEGLGNAIYLIQAGATPVIVVLGMVCMALAIRQWFSAERSKAGTNMSHGWLLTVPAMLSFVQFVALAADKPGEYGRFALLIDVALAIATGMLLSRLADRWKITLATIVLIGVVLGGGAYVRGFVRDCGRPTSRMAVASRLASMPPGPITIEFEPAPFGVPPMNLFERQLILIPTVCPLTPEVRVHESWLTPISWADIQFEVSR